MHATEGHTIECAALIAVRAAGLSAVDGYWHEGSE